MAFGGRVPGTNKFRIKGKMILIYTHAFYRQCTYCAPLIFRINTKLTSQIKETRNLVALMCIDIIELVIMCSDWFNTVWIGLMNCIEYTEPLSSNIKPPTPSNKVWILGIHSLHDVAGQKYQFPMHEYVLYVQENRRKGEIRTALVPPCLRNGANITNIIYNTVPNIIQCYTAIRR